MSGIFEELEMFDEGDKVATRQAIAVANKRFNDKFAGFLRQASSKKEFESRLALVEQDIDNMVADVAYEYGGDAEKIATSIKMAFEAMEGNLINQDDSWDQAVNYIIQTYGTQNETEENARYHLDQVKDQILATLGPIPQGATQHPVESVIKAIKTFYDLTPNGDQSICQNCGGHGCAQCSGDSDQPSKFASDRPEHLKAQDEVQLAEEHSQVNPWLKKQIQDEDQEDGGNLRNKTAEINSQPIANPVPLAERPGYTAGGEDIETALEQAPSAVGTGKEAAAHTVEKKGDKFVVVEDKGEEAAGPFDSQEDAYARANELNDLENLEKKAGIFGDIGKAIWGGTKALRNLNKETMEKAVIENICPDCIMYKGTGLVEGDRCSPECDGTFASYATRKFIPRPGGPEINPIEEYNKFREALGVPPISDPTLDDEFDYDDPFAAPHDGSFGLTPQDLVPPQKPGLVDRAKDFFGVGQQQQQPQPQPQTPAAPEPTLDDEFEFGYEDPFAAPRKQTSVTPAMARALQLKHAAEVDTGDKTEKREKLPTGDESALGGPSPKIDKKKWVPNATNADGNLEPIDTEGENSPVPSRQMDIKQKPDYQNDDPWEHDNNVWEREQLPTAKKDEAGFEGTRNIEQPTKAAETFPDKGQADPVTRKALAAWYSEDSLFRNWLADHGIEMLDDPELLKESPVIRSLWKQFVQDVPAPAEGDDVIGERQDAPIDEPAVDEPSVEDLVEEPLEEPVEEEVIVEETPEDVERIIEREDKEGDRVKVVDEGDEDVDLDIDEDFKDIEDTDPFEFVDSPDDDEIKDLLRDIEENPDDWQ